MTPRGLLDCSNDDCWVWPAHLWTQAAAIRRFLPATGRRCRKLFLPSGWPALPQPAGIQARLPVAAGRAHGAHAGAHRHALPSAWRRMERLALRPSAEAALDALAQLSPHRGASKGGGGGHRGGVCPRHRSPVPAVGLLTWTSDGPLGKRGRRPSASGLHVLLDESAATSGELLEWRCDEARRHRGEHAARSFRYGARLEHRHGVVGGGGRKTRRIPRLVNTR